MIFTSGSEVVSGEDGGHCAVVTTYFVFRQEEIYELVCSKFGEAGSGIFYLIPGLRLRFAFGEGGFIAFVVVVQVYQSGIIRVVCCGKVECFATSARDGYDIFMSQHVPRLSNACFDVVFSGRAVNGGRLQHRWCVLLTHVVCV